ncbi:MAG TPA: transketolase [Planctomycetota bacterium]|nr:transketolase [Planctomycetota bacterium]
MTAPRFTGRDLRRRVIEISLKAGVGHIGSALSICDLVAVLLRDLLQGIGTEDPGRDRFILSKGHASLALYCALERIGLLSSDELGTFCKDGSRLGVHPEKGVPGVEITTGSLGMGLSVGAGLALSARLRRSSSRTCVLISDAECNEGSLWEAVMFAAHHRLASLTAVLDLNGLQAMGATKEILDLSGMEDRWRSFGWDARMVDGHDEAALAEAFRAPRAEGRPRVLIARTVLGKGVSFMENRQDWHYYPVNAEQARQALTDLERAP